MEEYFGYKKTEKGDWIVTSKQGRYTHILKMRQQDKDEVLVNKYNGTPGIENMAEYLYRFPTEEEAKAAIEWMESIVVMNKLSGNNKLMGVPVQFNIVKQRKNINPMKVLKFNMDMTLKFEGEEGPITHQITNIFKSNFNI